MADPHRCPQAWPRTGRRAAAAGSRPEVRLAGQPHRARHVRQARSTVPTRSPAARSTRSTSIVPACCTRASSARRIRTRASCRSICPRRSARRASRPRSSGAIPASAQNNRVMFQGDEVAAVAADTEEHAIDAARLVKVEYEVLPHVTVVEQALAGHGAGGVHRRQRAPGADAGDRRSRGGLQGGGAHDRGDLRDARHHARLHGVARHRVRVGRRQADGLDLDAGHQRRARELRHRARAFRRPTSASSASTWAAASAARR